MDVIIIGAGAAGLAAADLLIAAGASVRVLEARERIGGRMLTLHTTGVTAPIELGAEFLHGDAREVRTIAHAAGLADVSITDKRYISSNGRLQPMDDYWSHLDNVMRRLSDTRDPDRSFADALAANRKSLSAADRALALQFVENFHAADPAVVSERALADGGTPCEDVREMRVARLAQGYGALTDTLAARSRAHIELGAVVTAIRWREGHVEVDYADSAGVMRDTLVARRVVITVSVGVLAAGGITFSPPLPAAMRAVQLMPMGKIIKLVLQFDTPFWLDAQFAKRVGQEGVDEMSFMQARHALPFPVWWTPYPVRAPILTAWTGEPASSALATASLDELRAAAVTSLATMLAMRPASIRNRLVAVFHHDWINDPFTRGAYSYARVGGHRASMRLARPIKDTIWFAGEAADREGRTGTVHGALASGARAAREILRLSA
jgi:monoamine oxidase